MERSELKNEVFSLREKVCNLYSQLEKFRLEREAEASEATRLQGIVKLISQRTPIGAEEDVERKLNTWFNGLH